MGDRTSLRVAIYSPDRARYYDGRTPEAEGVGGGITARLSLAAALAALGHEVTAYVHCEAPIQHLGVAYVPIDGLTEIDCDVFIAISTGGALSFAPLRAIRVTALHRTVWVQGVPQPADLEAVSADSVCVASEFLRDVCATRWRVPAHKLFVCHNGIHQEYFKTVDANPPERDPYAIAYVGPPEKGLDACISVLRRLRAVDERFHLDVSGGDRLWGRAAGAPIDEPGLRDRGLLGQRDLAAALFTYEYCLALQAMEEGFGMAVQEAKRAGVIVLASRVGAFPELMTHGVDGYLISGAHNSTPAQAEAADLILHLSDDPGRRLRIRRRARTTPYDWHLAARTWTSHWNRVLGRTTTEAISIDVPNTQRKVFIAGWYGHGNLGDEAILSVVLDHCQQVVPGLVPVVSSGDPAQTSRQHDVSAIDDRDIPALARAAAESALIIIGGGGPFHDYYGVDEAALLTSRAWGLTSCVTWPVLARLANTPLMVLAVGVGPLHSATSQRYTRVVFEQADASSVRDVESRDLLAALGVNIDRVAVTADPAFLLPSADRTGVRTHMRRMGIRDNAPVVSVALRDWDLGPDGRAWEASVAGALDLLVDRTQATVVFVPFQSRSGQANTDDVSVATRVQKLMRCHEAVVLADADLGPSVVQGIFEASTLVVAMRLHAVILAANANTPFVALRYDDKVGHTVRRLGLAPFVADLTTITAGSLFARMISAMSESERITHTLRDRLTELREAARTGILPAVDLVTRGATSPRPASAEWTTIFEGARRTLGEGERRQPSNSPEPWSALRSVARRVVPAQWRRVARDGWQRRLMSPAAFVFDRYKRQRIREYGADLSGVRAPGEPGLVSIVLPAYNGAATIRESIDSVLSQADTPLELIIVNDGSTDGTAAIADDYARRDARVRVVHQENQTLPLALSRGFQLARGEFLTWTSCDNRFTPLALRKLVDCLRRHPQWDMVYANVDLIGADGAPLTHSPHYASYQVPHGSHHVRLPPATTELNTRSNNFIGAGFLYRSRVAWLLGDYDRFRFGLEDYDYWMRVNALMTLRHADFDDPVVEYRFHDASLTAQSQALELPAKSTRLLVFDQFRRDAYLSPVVWVFADRSAPISAALEQRARQAGHTIYDGAYSLADLSPCWLPIVCVASTDSASPVDLLWANPPPGAVTALVADASAPMPDWAERWDLRVGVGAVAADSPGAGHGIGRGWLMTPDIDRLFQAIDIGVKTRGVAAVEALAEAPPVAALKATVVICTFQASVRLSAAIDSVLAQDFPSHQFQLVIVNNNPGDAELNTELTRRLDDSRVVVVVCPIPGHSAAKNAGFGAARGDCVCFLDDDAVAERDWLARICAAFDEHPETGVVGGPILLESPNLKPAALVNGWTTYWSHFQPAVTAFTDVKTWADFPWGANWAARRRVLAAIGGFRTSFGRKRADFAGGEELVAAELATRLGYGVAIVPDAVVHHHVDPDRFTAEDVRRTMAVRHLLAYAAKRDLIVPGARGVPSTLARLALHHVDPRVRSWPHFWSDVAYRKSAQLGLLKAQLSDLRDRRRRPVSELP